jgi:hypothetical protein
MMTRARESWRREARSLLVVPCAAAALATAPIPASAHEPTQTHRRLTLAGLSLISADFFRYPCPSDKTPTGTTTGCSVDGFTEYEIARELAQGAIDEDLCVGRDDHGLDWQHHANFYSHLWDVKGGHKQDWPTLAPTSEGCSGKDWTQQTPAARARDLWRKATIEYASGNELGAYRVLGRMLHLLEDMTSPAHVHADPHGWVPDDEIPGGGSVSAAEATSTTSKTGDTASDLSDQEAARTIPNHGQKIYEHFAFQAEPNIEPDKHAIGRFAEPKIQAPCEGVLSAGRHHVPILKALSRHLRRPAAGRAGIARPGGGEDWRGQPRLRVRSCRVAEIVYDFTTFVWA